MISPLMKRSTLSMSVRRVHRRRGLIGYPLLIEEGCPEGAGWWALSNHPGASRHPSFQGGETLGRRERWRLLRRFSKFADREWDPGRLHQQALAHRLVDLGELVVHVGDVQPLVELVAGFLREPELPAHALEFHGFERLDQAVRIGAFRLLDRVYDQKQRIGRLEDEPVRLVV